MKVKFTIFQWSVLGSLLLLTCSVLAIGTILILQKSAVDLPQIVEPNNVAPPRLCLLSR